MLKNLVNIILVFGIYVSIFTSFELMREPAQIYAGYIVMFILLPFFFIRYKIPKWSLIFFILLITGCVNIYFGNNEVDRFLKVFIGLYFSYLFYYYVILAFDHDTEKLFRYYLKGAYIMSCIGLFQFISFKIGFESCYRLFGLSGYFPGGELGIRINALVGEPSHYGTLMSAAFFVAVCDLLFKNPYYYKKYQSLLIIFVYILSFSGTGNIAILITVVLLLLNFGLIRYMFIAIPIGMLIFIYMYKQSDEFRSRYDSMIEVFTTGEWQIGKTHGSAIILYNNYHIVKENFKVNFAFGGGIGSHPVAAGKYSITKNIGVYGFELNFMDANSMLLRIISETGLFGLVLMLLLIFKGYVNRMTYPDEKTPKHFWLISNAILVLVLANFLRQGHYFLNGFPFFIWLYYYNNINLKRYLSDTFQLQNNPATTIK